MSKAVVTYIEGTSLSLTFVKEVLFLYARANLADYVRRNIAQQQVKKIMAATCQEINAELDAEQSITQLIQWIDEDKKVTPLKSLQGLIWEAGYQRADFKGHIYPDAVENLKKWKAKGLDLYVYSSGSVQAQKLLFAHTDYGDLTSLFSGYFDTHIGGKKEPKSYSNIAKNIDIPPDHLLFLSDIKDELDAAKSAGYQTAWLLRAGALEAKAEHLQVSSFDQITP